jgi:3-hydroxyacyl-CoA dehydrogenase
MEMEAHIAAIGAGSMDHSIAQMFAVAFASSVTS